MDLFSSNAEDTIKKRLQPCVSAVTSISNQSELEDIFDLNRCSEFVLKGGFSKVCLQFPDSLLQFSVQVALWLEKSTKQKVYILGDTSYGSCCVDELAAQHVEGDAVIHMGHTCLSPTSRLPVLLVLPRATLDLPHFLSAFTDYASLSTGPILLLYDVAYSHLVDDVRGVLRDWQDKVIVSQLCLPSSEQWPCGASCQLHQGLTAHSTTLLGRHYCCPQPSYVVYIVHNSSQNMINFALSLRDAQFFTYSKESDTEPKVFTKNLRRRLYLVEKVKDAKSLGIIVGTLSVDKFLDAIQRVKELARYRGKRCYTFSIGRPNPAKLANFPEVEVFVLVSCPEACLGDEKEYLQPVVTLLEAELALNPNRQWDDKISADFRDLLEGALPEGEEPLAADVSLISNRIRSDAVISDAGSGSDLIVREHYQISVASSYSAGRHWRGLEQALGETPVSQATLGRSGIPLMYDEEKPHQTT